MTASETRPGLIFVMIGPGGAGKNAIMKAVMRRMPALRQLATATTRPMRPDEKQGREHRFVDRRQFARMIAADELLEHQEVTPGRFYGIPRGAAERALATGAVRIADIEVLGAKALASAFPENVVQIFITVPGADVPAQLKLLEARMRGRADRFTDIDHRLERARALELPYQARCDHVVVNDSLARAIEATATIIHREMAARSLIGGET